MGITMSEQAAIADASGFFKKLNALSAAKKTEEMSLETYLERCKNGEPLYMNIGERMLEAMGKPKRVDTKEAADKRLGRIFGGEVINLYEAMQGFYGMESVIEEIAAYFSDSAKFGEMSKQILYLLGPAGGGKSSLAKRLGDLIERVPMYVLVAPNGEVSPCFESPLGLFYDEERRKLASEHYGIPEVYFNLVPSPWAAKRIMEADGDISQFKVRRIYPSRLQQIGYAKVEPGDENNQDVSNIVGKVDIRKLERHGQADADAYSYSGGLNRTTQGLMEFVEMFKAPLKMLSPLLESTQGRSYAGTENVGVMPYGGVVVAHSNEAEWQDFRNKPENEAFIQRIKLVRVPYVLRWDQEVAIYEKMLTVEGGYRNAKIAPHTLELLAKFSVLSRLKEHENSTAYSKMLVYAGEDMKDRDPNAKTILEYREAAGNDEGMKGSSTRFAFKILSEVFNREASKGSGDLAADPVTVMSELERAIKAEDYPQERRDELLEIVTDLKQRYLNTLGAEISKIYVESSADFAQNMFDRYYALADSLEQNEGCKDPSTGQILDVKQIEEELDRIEKGSGIGNAKTFRKDFCGYVNRHKSKNAGMMPAWDSYTPMKTAIEKRLHVKLEDMAPVISFGTKMDRETEKKHTEFVQRMMDNGYTEAQIKRLVEWRIREKSASHTYTL